MTGRLLPSSLAGRTVLLVVAVIAITEIATFSLLSHFDRGVHVSRTVQLIVGEVRLLQRVLPGLDRETRQQLMAADGSERGLNLRPDGQGVPEHRPDFAFARRLADKLAKRLGEPALLRDGGQGAHSGLWIGFTAGGERWWLVLPTRRFEPPAISSEIWLALSAMLATIVVIAGIFVRGIVGPLARLGEAVVVTDDGTTKAASTEGPLEVRRLAERHNLMRDQLAKAAAERREMLAGLTHDLRAPLARLRLRLALLDNDAERDGLARDINDMERIVGQCLDFLGSESASGHPMPLHIAARLGDEIARQRALGRNVRLTIDKRAADSQVPISDVDLQRLLDNLIENAVQHGAPPVEVRLALEPGKRLVLHVRDHGPGIAIDDRERALVPFVQLQPERATDGSCGLGLAIVRRIAAAAGGEVTLENAPQGGLDVFVRLPCIAPSP